MSRQTVNAVIQKAISDGAFRHQLERDPSTALAGFDLTTEERAAITSGDPTRLTALGVEQRMSKAFAIGGLSAGNPALVTDAASASNAVLIDEASITRHGALVDDPGVSNAALVSDPGLSNAALIVDGGAGSAALVVDGASSSAVIVGDPFGAAPAAFEPDASWSGSESVLPPEDAAAAESLNGAADGGGDPSVM